MSYNALINSNLKLAYNAVKDLAKPVTFTKTASTSFNFTTGAASAVTEGPISTKAVILSDKKTSSASKVVNREIMFRTTEVGDIKLFDSVTIDNLVWKLGTVVADSGFIIILQIYREV